MPHRAKKKLFLKILRKVLAEKKTFSTFALSKTEKGV
jgi:hypothetical protein